MTSEPERLGYTYTAQILASALGIPSLGFEPGTGPVPRWVVVWEKGTAFGTQQLALSVSYGTRTITFPAVTNGAHIQLPICYGPPTAATWGGGAEPVVVAGSVNWHYTDFVS